MRSLDFSKDFILQIYSLFAFNIEARHFSHFWLKTDFVRLSYDQDKIRFYKSNEKFGRVTNLNIHQRS